MRIRTFLLAFCAAFGLLFFWAPGIAQAQPTLFQMEGGQFSKTDTYQDPVWDTVNLQNTYDSPVVFIIPRNDGSHSADFRIRNITSTSFETTVVEPPGWDGPHVAMTVSYIVAEEGGWFLTSDIFLYVGIVELTNIVNSEEEDWLTVDLPQGFTNPIVIAQLQEMPNEQNNLPLETSQPWFTAAVRNVTATSFQVALDGGRCTNVSTSSNPDCAGPYTNLNPELLGYLVIEANLQETFTDANSASIQLETIKTGNTIIGWNDGGTVVPFATTFPNNMPLFVAKPQTRNAADGGWFRFRDLSDSQVTLLVDEALDHQGNDRYHSANPESAGAVLFSQNFEVVDLDPDKDFIPVAYDNCPYVYNPAQEDLGDGDGVGDACDCGDGLVVASEHCDDGNQNDGDGCSAGCLYESGWWCEGEPSVCDGICGDGQVLGAEVCDDGNTQDDPGCASDCKSFCGDGALNANHGEVCDGAQLGGATCENIGLGFTGGTLACDSVCALDTTGCTLCGNGLLESGEACDDGNNISGDGCTDTCEPEAGWTCTGEPSVCVGDCGDGVLQGMEACDDGNTQDGDGCDPSCGVEPGWECAGEPSVCQPICGDGNRLADEECDDGNTQDGDGCSSSCEVESGWVCPGGPGTCHGVCGNGSLEADEACDDGNDEQGDGCFQCGVENGWECSGSLGATSYCRARCGDGVILGLEACDDGDALGGDGCAGTCQIEPGWECSGEPSVCVSTCGDGWVVDAETCDDGNNEDGDGCDADCVTEPGYVCTGNPSLCIPSCGNGSVDEDEGCDDGNLFEGDGCTPTCEIEEGFTCEGSPSICCFDKDEDGECDPDQVYHVGGDGACYCRGVPSSRGSLPTGPAGPALPLLLSMLGISLWRRRRQNKGD